MDFLQYVDDFLLSRLTEKEVTDTKISLLTFLGCQEVKSQKLSYSLSKKRSNIWDILD
jgi:hypothetical protein